MSDLPDSGAGVAEEDGSSSEHTTDDSEEEKEVKGEKSKVAEKLDPQRVLPHLRCGNCQAFFRGAVYTCGKLTKHSTCSSCCNNTGLSSFLR